MQFLFRLVLFAPLLLILPLLPLQAQSNWEVTAYGMEHGLPDRTIYGHAMDRQQLHWLATANGLCRFDGSQFFAFPKVGKVFVFSAFSSSSFSIDPYQRLIFQIIPESDSFELFDLASYTQQKVLGYQYTPYQNLSSIGKTSNDSLVRLLLPGLVERTRTVGRVQEDGHSAHTQTGVPAGVSTGAGLSSRTMHFGQSKFTGLLAKDNAPHYQIRRVGQQAFIFRLEADNYWHLVYIVEDLGAPLLSERPLSDQIIYVDDESLVLYFGDQHKLMHLSLKGNNYYYALPESPPNTPPFCFRDQNGRIWYLDKQQQIIRCFSSTGEIIENAATKWMETVAPTEGWWWSQVWEDENNNLLFGAVGPNLTDHLLLLKADGQIEDLAEVLAVENKIIGIKGKNFSEGFTMASHGGFYVCSRLIKRKLPITNYLDTLLAPGQFGAVIRGFAQTAEAVPTIFVNTESSRWFKLEPPHYRLQAVVKTDESGKPITERLDCSNNLLSLDGFIYGMSCRLDDAYTGYIHRFDPRSNKWRHYDIPEYGSFARIIHPAREKGKLWVFTLNRANRNNHIFLLDTESGIFKEIGSLFYGLERGQKGTVQYALTDQQGTLWAATTNGLYSLAVKTEGAKDKSAAAGSAQLLVDNPYTIQAFFPSSGVRTPITAMSSLPDGRLLLGTFGSGIQIFDPATATFSSLAFKTNSTTTESSNFNIPGLTNDNIAYLEPLNEHRFLVPTYDGFCVLDLQSKQIFTYNTSDGFPSNEFNRLSLLIDSTKQLFVGGINGFSRLNTAVFDPPAVAPQPIISRFFSFREGTLMEQSQLLQVGEISSLTLESDVIYFGLDFAMPVALPLRNKGFQTWLEGWESGYGEITSKSSVRYNRLAAGKYKLHIKGFDALGQPSRDELIIPIRVKLPWYKRPWVIVLSQLLLVLAIWLYNTEKVKRLRAEEAKKRQQERRNAEMELKILRQQLNPHFIFNSLGAIQAYIQQQKGEEAVVYLADFARLMRLFLESSKQSYISIREELELLQLYVKLEQLRFQHRFEVTYTIGEELDIDEEEIPALLLQPFVENAINHGLFHLEAGGELNITMRSGCETDSENENCPQEECLFISITDNGVGRKIAGEIQAQSYRKHKSRATQITAERLEILEQSGETQLRIRTEDAYPDRLHTGTRVVVIIINKV